MELNGKIWLAKSDEKVFLEPKMANDTALLPAQAARAKQ